jgi:hypothetical protein
MAKASKIKVPKRILGTKIPKAIRKDLKALVRSLEKHDAASLIAAAIATWVMAKLADQPAAAKAS